MNSGLLTWTPRDQFKIMVLKTQAEREEKYRRVHKCVTVYTYISSLCPPKKSRSNKTPAVMSTPDAQILVSTHFSNRKNRGCLEKWLDPGPEEGKHKMSLEKNICGTIKEGSAKYTHTNLSRWQDTKATSKRAARGQTRTDRTNK